MPPIDMVIIDEEHRWFDAYEEWLEGPWSHLPVIGLTATPWTKGLGKHFDRLIIGSTTQQLIDTGYLSRFRVFAPASPSASTENRLWRSLGCRGGLRRGVRLRSD